MKFIWLALQYIKRLSFQPKERNHTIFYPKDIKIYRLKDTGEIGPLISPFIFQSGPIKIQMNSGKKHWTINSTMDYHKPNINQIGYLYQSRLAWPQEHGMWPLIRRMLLFISYQEEGSETVHIHLEEWNTHLWPCLRAILALSPTVRMQSEEIWTVRRQDTVPIVITC